MFIVIVILVAALIKGTEIVIGDSKRKIFPSNPGGKNPGGQGPGAANDESSGTTFLDLNFGSRKESVVIFPINGDARKVFSYELATGSDFSIRDPTEWNVYGGQSADGPWTLFSHVIADAPSSRRASYGRRDTCLSTPDVAAAATPVEGKMLYAMVAESKVVPSRKCPKQQAGGIYLKKRGLATVLKDN